MSDWPVGLSTGCFYQSSIFDCLDQILSEGFSLIEVCSSPRHLDYHNLDAVREVRNRLRDLGIGAYSFHAPFADTIDITSSDSARRRQSIDEVSAAAEASSVLGCRYFLIHPGPEHAVQPTGDEKLERLRNVADSLSKIAEHCRAAGVTCVIENKLPHLIFGNTADMLWILGAMERTGIGVCLDTGHAFLGGELETAFNKLSHHLRMLHASDNFGSKDEHLAPGAGKIDWRRILSLLRQSRFDGTIIIEMSGHGSPSEILKQARRGRQYLRDLAWRDAFVSESGLD